MPLLVTLLFLAWSALAYEEELAADPTKVNIPFLLLWERRFDGSAIPAFSTTVVITGVLLVVVLGLTLLAHRLETGALRACRRSRSAKRFTGFPVAPRRRASKGVESVGGQPRRSADRRLRDCVGRILTADEQGGVDDAPTRTGAQSTASPRPSPRPSACCLTPLPE